MRLDPHPPADDGVAHHGAGIDPAVRPEDGAVDHGVAAYGGPRADHAVGQNGRAAAHARAGADEAGGVEPRTGVDGGGRIHERPACASGERVCRAAAAHDVPVRLHVLLRGPDVDPVAPFDVGDERFPPLDERRKVAALDGVLRSCRNAVEGVGLEHVDARVDRVAGDRVGRRLLAEGAHVARGVRLDQPVGRRIVDRRQDDRGPRAARAVPVDDGAQVDGGQHVAVEHHDRAVEVRCAEPDGAPGAQRLRLDRVADARAASAAVADDALDGVRPVVEAQNDLVDLGQLPEQVDLVVQQRPVEDRHDRLGRVAGQRTQPRAESAGEQDGLHAIRVQYGRHAARSAARSAR